MTSVALIDSGGANIASLIYAFRRLRVDAKLTRDARAIREASHVVLPGVGAAADAMQRLDDAGLLDVIRNLSQPLLGICLGMQLLCDGSEEEDVGCLGIIPGVARKLPASPSCPVPNMGWCETTFTGSHPLLTGIDDGDHFYYLHSYALPVLDYTIATVEHDQPYSAVLSYRNFFATQFHPERSSVAGRQLLRNFLATAS